MFGCRYIFCYNHLRLQWKWHSNRLCSLRLRLRAPFTSFWKKETNETRQNDPLCFQLQSGSKSEPLNSTCMHFVDSLKVNQKYSHTTSFWLFFEYISYHISEIQGFTDSKGSDWGSFESCQNTKIQYLCKRTPLLTTTTLLIVLCFTIN